MAKFTSKYPEYGFYHAGELKRFSNGGYVTDDDKEIALLATFRDVSIVDEPKPEAKPATKAPAKRTASGK